MNNPYALHTWSKHYREDALREARVHHLTHPARAHRRPCSEEQGRWSSWLGKLAAAVGSS
jgi:hypothetical protein